MERTVTNMAGSREVNKLLVDSLISWCTSASCFECQENRIARARLVVAGAGCGAVELFDKKVISHALPADAFDSMPTAVKPTVVAVIGRALQVDDLSWLTDALNGEISLPTPLSLLPRHASKKEVENILTAVRRAYEIAKLV